MSAPSVNDAYNTALIERLAHHFYQVVPSQYKTYCAFTSQIVQKVLVHFGVPCERVPCQIWYVKPDHIYVIGFLGKNEPHKWDGHVVCCAQNILIDTATHHFEREFDLKVPWVVITRMFEFPTTSMAHMNVNATDTLWWQPPPHGVDATPPEEPRDLVEAFAGQLIHVLESSTPPLAPKIKG